MAKHRILLVDDDRLILATFGQGLRHCGYEVQEAASGEQAVLFCQESPAPDLAILDVRMPSISGVEPARIIREQTQVPFVFLSAYDDPDVVRLAVEEGALGYLVKPVDVPKVVPTIEAAMARASELRELRQVQGRLNAALETSREISMAVGLLMARYRLDRQSAFEALRFSARSQRRKVEELANEMIRAEEQLTLSPDVLSRLKPTRG